MFVIAHELFDALPVHQFKYLGPNKWCEKVIALDKDQLVYTDSAPNTETVVKVLQQEKLFSEQAKKDLKEGDMFEICPSANKFT
jgi:SAM-dependent MidA family methyltransferase